MAGNAAYILGTLAESEMGCLRVISLTSSKSGETSKILLDLTNMLTFEDSESVMNAAGTMGTLVRNFVHFSHFTCLFKRPFVFRAIFVGRLEDRSRQVLGHFSFLLVQEVTCILHNSAIY